MEVEGRCVWEMRWKKKEEKFEVWEDSTDSCWLWRWGRKWQPQFCNHKTLHIAKNPKWTKNKIFLWAYKKESSLAEDMLILAQWGFCQISDAENYEAIKLCCFKSPMFLAICHGSQRKLIQLLNFFIQVKCIFLMHLREVHKSISFSSFSYIGRKVKKCTPHCRLWSKSGLLSVVGNRPQGQWTTSVWNSNAMVCPELD